MGKAKLTPTGPDLIKSIRDVEKKQAGRGRADFAGVTTVSKALGSGGQAATSSTLTKPFPTSGGTIVGPLALFPKTIEIASGVLDLTDATAGNIGKNTSNVNVIGQGTFDDDLTTITAGIAGQMLILKGGGTNITIKDGTGNIVTPGNVDYVMNDDEGALLIFDSVGGDRWIVLGAAGGAGGSGMQNPAIEVLDMAGWGIDNAGNIAFQFDVDAFILGTGNNIQYSVGNLDQHNFTVNGTSRFGVDNTYVHVLNSILRLRDTTSTGQVVQEYVSDDPSPGDFNTIASTLFYGENSGSSKELYAKVDINTNDVTSGTEDGEYAIAVTGAGFTSAARLVLNHTELTLHRQWSNTLGDGCDFVLYNDDSSMSDGQTVGKISMDSNDSGLNQTTYAEIVSFAEDVTNGTEDGSLALKVVQGSSLTTYMTMNIGSSQQIKMEKSLDMDDNNVFNVGQLSFSVAIAGQFFDSSVAGIQYHVPSSDSHDFYVAGSKVLDIDDAHLNMYNKEIDFNAGGRVDFADNATTIGSNGSATALTANPVGYAMIRVNGVERQIPYYRVA